jgi:uracil-DNA glycosylase
MKRFESLLRDVHACRICEAHLPAGPRPVLQVHPEARLLLASQAPGRKVHESGTPFDDASGSRLREWMGVTRDVFYDPTLVAILPMSTDKLTSLDK